MNPGLTKTALLSVLFSAALSFSDTLTLSQAENIASENSFQVKAAMGEKNAARWERFSTIGTLLPSISFSTNWLQFEGGDQTIPGEQIPSTGAGPAITGEGYNHQLTISQPIFNGGGEVIGYLAASSSVSAAEYQLKSARQTAIASVREAYFNAQMLSEQKRIDSISYEWARTNQYRAQVRYEEGVIPPYELLRWEAEVADRKGNLVSSSAAYKIALAQLYTSMGRTLNEGQNVELQSASLLESWYDSTATLPAGSAQNNPDLKAAQEQLTTASRGSVLNLTQYLPSFNGFVQYTWPPQDQLFPQGDNFWTYGIQANWTLFSGAQRYSDYRKSQFQLEALSAQTEQLNETVQISIFQSRTQFIASKEQVSAAKSRYELMQRTLSMVEERYESGLVGIIDLLDTRITADSAYILYLQSLANAIMARTAYLRATGLLEVDR